MYVKENMQKLHNRANIRKAPRDESLEAIALNICSYLRQLFANESFTTSISNNHANRGHSSN